LRAAVARIAKPRISRQVLISYHEPRDCRLLRSHAGDVVMCWIKARTTIGIRGWWQMQRLRLRRDLISINKQARLFSLLIKRPDVPWPAKAASACAIAYVFSPIQLIPTFIPIIGQLDDLLVLFLGTRIVRRITPPAILGECESRAESASSAQIAQWEHILRDSRRVTPSST
jgi:uncharacterized membrane protein YkvA (DUF1232 family)